MPTAPGVRRSNAELPHLVRAQRLRAMGLGWTAAAFLLASVALMGAGMGLLLVTVAHVAAAVAGIVATAAAIGAATGVRRGRARRREARGELDAAWDLVGADVLASRAGETTALELARAMQTDVEYAEAMLSRLASTDRVRVDVRDDAELAYRVEEGADADASAGAGAGAKKAAP